MNIDIGDLVAIKKNNSDISILGIVVKKYNSNQGIEKSIHVKHMLNSLPPIFYVYSHKGSHGPYLRSDLMLYQSYTNFN